jgi:hypothetical protein
MEARSGGDRLKPVPPGRLRSPQGHADVLVRDHIKDRTLPGQFGRFTSQWWRPARDVVLGARVDVTGIPVSVLHPGVEA